MVVTRGPSMWKVPGSDGLVLAVASAAGSPSVSIELPFRFTKPIFVAGVLTLLRPAAAMTTAQLLAAMGNVSLRILDEKNDPIMIDTRGTIRGTANAPVAAPLLALHGKGFAPAAFQRRVVTDRQVNWSFQLQNEDTLNTFTVAGIFLYIEKPHGVA